MIYKYKNVSESEQTLAIDGNIEPRNVKSGETCISSVIIENPNFEFISKDEASDNKVDGVVAEQPNAITEAELVETNNQETE